MAHRSPLPAAALISTLLSLALLLVAGGLTGGRHTPSSAFSLNPGGSSSMPAQQLSAQPLAFEPTRASGSYLVRGTNYELTVSARGTRLIGRGGDIRTQLAGARPAPAAAADRQTLVVNRYQGADRNWRTAIPTYGRVSYGSVYPGIDLAYHGRGGALEYDFVVRPGADPGRIGLTVSGADRVRIDTAGNLVASDGRATFRQHQPVAYQEVRGKRRYVDARFAIRDGRVQFVLGRYDRSRALVIDPTLTYADYIGGANDDAAARVAVDSGGNIYVVGSTKSTSIPGTSGTRASTTQYDAFVLKIAPNHSRSWITYLGGAANDSGNDIGLDSQGRPYISGATRSNDFPDGDGQPLTGPQDAFVAAFGTDGTKRWANTWSTSDDMANPLYSLGNSIAVQGDGTSYFGLGGQNTDPTTQTAPTKSYGFIVKTPTSGTGATYWSVDGDGGANTGPGTLGTSDIGGLGIKPGCDSNCTVYYAGHSNHSFQCGGNPVSIQTGYIGAFNFSTGTNPWGAGAFNIYTEECGANQKVGVTALAVSHAGDPMIIGQATLTDASKKPHVFFARYAGSNGWFDPLPFAASTEASSAGYDITFDSLDNVIIGGFDSQATGDLQGAIQSAFNGGFSDGTILKINLDGPAITSDPGGATPHEAAAIVFGTLYGGSATDTTVGVASDPSGNVYFVGQTISLSKFPTEGATQDPGIAGSLGDGFIGVIRPTLAQITGGPSGTTQSRDAKFTFSAGPEPGFAHAAEEVGAKFQCKLSPVTADFGACPPGGYTGLADGNYKFEVRAIDTGGGTAGAVSREFTVDTTPKASFTIAPNPALVGRAVAFDASGSSASTAIAKYEWDLDGNGSFETNSGTTPTVSQTYPSAGTFTVGLKITDGEGRSATATNNLQVNAATGPGTQFGVTINNGAQFTNDPDVTVTATFPSFTTGLLFSNDGGFGKAQTFAAKKETPWKLDSSGPERLPKTIYVRFLTGSISSTSFQDDIILDETPPKVAQAAITGGGGGAASAAVLRKFTVKMKATDKTSGVSLVQVTANKKKPGKALKYRRKFVVKAAKRPKWVRARDRAGNWSKWKKAR